MREGQYSFSAKKKDKHLIELGDEYKIVAIRTRVTFSSMVFKAMKYYKEQGMLPESGETNGRR